MITEIETIPGYVLNAEPQTVKVNANDVQTLTFENTKIGSLIVKKVDSKTGKPLAGVEFEIEGCRGCDYPTGKYVADVNGMIRLDNIPSGFYAVTETKTIDGYLLNDQTETVKVTGGVTQEVTVRNDPLGGLLIRVMDEKPKNRSPRRR